MALLATWALKPLHSKPYENSAPSRITGFLRKRRLPSRILGVVLMVLSAAIIGETARRFFFAEGDITMPALALTIFVLADALYLSGRRLWQRLT